MRSRCAKTLPAQALILHMLLIMCLFGTDSCCFAALEAESQAGKEIVATVDFPVTFRTAVDSKMSGPGDQVEAELTGTLKFGDSVLAPAGTILTGFVSKIGKQQANDAKQKRTARNDGPVTIKFLRLTAPDGTKISVTGTAAKQSCIVGNGRKAKRLRVNDGGEILEMRPVGPTAGNMLKQEAGKIFSLGFKAIGTASMLAQSSQMRAPSMGMMGGGSGMMGGMGGSPLTTMFNSNSAGQSVLSGMLRSDNVEDPSLLSNTDSSNVSGANFEGMGQMPAMDPGQGSMAGMPSMGMGGGGMPSMSIGGVPPTNMGGPSSIGAGSALQNLLQMMPTHLLPGSQLSMVLSTTQLATRATLPLLMQFLPKAHPPAEISYGLRPVRGKHQAMANPSIPLVHIDPSDQLTVHISISCNQLAVKQVTGKLLGSNTFLASENISTVKTNEKARVKGPRKTPSKDIKITYSTTCDQIKADDDTTSIDLPVSFQTVVDSNSVNVGDRIEALIKGKLRLGNRLVAPSGTRLIGHVTKVGSKHRGFGDEQKAGGTNEHIGSVTIAFDELITPDEEHIKLYGIVAQQQTSINNGGRFKLAFVKDTGEIIEVRDASSYRSKITSAILAPAMVAVSSFAMIRKAMPKRISSLGAPSMPGAGLLGGGVGALMGGPGGSGGAGGVVGPAGMGMTTLLPIILQAALSNHESQISGGSAAEGASGPTPSLQGRFNAPPVHIDYGDQLTVHLSFNSNYIKAIALADHRRKTAELSAAVRMNKKQLRPVDCQQEVEFRAKLDTRYLVENDPVQCAFTKDTILDHNFVVPAGSLVLGHVEGIRRSRRMGKAILSHNNRFHRNPSFHIVFNEIVLPNNKHIQISGSVIAQYHVFAHDGKIKVAIAGAGGEIEGMEDASSSADDTLPQTVQMLTRTGLLQFASPAISFGAMPVLMGIAGAYAPWIFSGKSMDEDNTSHSRGFILGVTAAIPGGGILQRFLLKGEEMVIEEGDRFLVDIYVRPTKSVTGVIIKSHTDASLQKSFSTVR